jgi:lipoprotein-releasing system permease protein
MKLEWLITKRIARSKKRAFSKLIVRIATVAIAISVAVMIITSALVKGFQQTITEKVYGFMGHVIIHKIDNRRDDRSYDDIPVDVGQKFYPELTELEEVRHIQVYGRKAGIIKNNNDIEGIILRGIDHDFDWDQFSQFIVEGDILSLNDTSLSRDIIISSATQKRMGFAVGDEMSIYFIDQSQSGNFRQRARRLRVAGIYNTGLEEFDKLFALIDIGHVRAINQWSDQQVGGFEVFLQNPEDLWEKTELVDSEVGPFLEVSNIRQLEPNIFDWLGLQTQNEVIIITLMMIVAIINMITSLLILILERTPMIGVLKALGARNISISRIFLFHAIYIVGVGLLWGNILGIGLSVLQEQFGLVRLPEESYYVKVAPIALDYGRIIALNVMSLLVCFVVLLIPSMLVARVDPIKALKFD